MNIKCPKCRFKFDIDVAANDSNKVPCICPRCGTDFVADSPKESSSLTEEKDIKASKPDLQGQPAVSLVTPEQPSVQHAGPQNQNRGNDKSSPTPWILVGSLATLLILGIAGWVWQNNGRNIQEHQLTEQIEHATQGQQVETQTEQTIATARIDQANNTEQANETLQQENTATAPQFYGQVSDPDGYTNIRRGPGKNYPVVGQCNSGDFLYYTPQNDGWSQVYSSKDANTFMGYIHSSRIKKINTSQASGGSHSTLSSNYREGYILDPVDDYVNVREGPGSKFAVVGRLDNHTNVYYTITGSNWYKVYDSNHNYIGYVFHDRIKKTK